MAVQTPDTQEEQDSAYNPGDLHAAEQFGEPSTSAGIDQAEAFANDPANASESVKDQEETPDQIPFTGNGSAPKQQSLRGKILGSAKKKQCRHGYHWHAAFWGIWALPAFTGPPACSA